MINYFKKPKQKIKRLLKRLPSQLSSQLPPSLRQGLETLQDTQRETLLYRILPQVFLDLMRKYFRLEVQGLENVPKRGGCIIAPNHSGYLGLDALLLAHVINKDVKRVPRVLTHYFWFLSKATAAPANKMGFTEATYENGISALKKNNLIMLFPEGESGNFKPTTKAYQLQEFKRGFIRMALETNSPIVPTLVIGAEESQINLKKLKLLKGVVLPLPLNLIPLPVKWKIIFLEPIYLPYDASSKDDRELVREIATDIQEQMQRALSREIQRSKGVTRKTKIR